MTAAALQLLAVEDDAEDFELLRRQLDRMPGYRCAVSWARNYQEARRHLEASPFDAVLVDYDLDAGHTALDVVRELPEANAFTPAIVITGMTDDADLRIVEAGAVDYLEKGQYSALDLERALRHAVDRKRVERQLRQTDQRYRGLVDVLGQMVWVVDAKGNPCDTNNWTTLTGQELPSIDDVENPAWLERIHPQDVPTVRKHWRESIENGTPYEACCRIRMQDDSYRWYQGQMVPLRDDSGAIREWIGVAIDIDDRQRIADALLEGNLRLMALVDTYRDVAAAGMDRDAIARCVAQSVRRLVGADIAAVARPVGMWMEYPTLIGENLPVDPIRVPIDQSITGWCMSHRKSVLCPDLTKDLRAAATALDLGIRSALHVPLIAGDGIVGVLTAMSRQVDAFRPDDLRALEVLGGMLAHALANADAWEQRQQLLAERSETLEKLRTSEEIFRALAEHSDEMINVLDADGRIRYTSPSVSRILGWLPEELAGMRPVDLVHPDDLAAMQSTWAALLQPGSDSCHVMVRLRHKDGSWRYMEGSGRNLLHLPAVRGITCNARDVTRRIEADRAKEFQSQLLQTVEQAVIATDLDGNATYVNAYAERQHGWLAQDMIGRNVHPLIVPPEHRHQMAGIIARVTRGESFGGELELQRRDGSRFTAVMTTTAIRDNSGRITGYLSVSRDITEMRSLEAQLRQSQKMNAVGQLAGGIAHDFNNLLTAITSYSELLLEDVSAEGQRNDLLEIQGAAHRAADLTKQLLAFSRNQAFRAERLDAVAVVSAMEKMLRRLISEDVELVTTYAAQTAPVMADRSQLEQVLLNLVLNARDAVGSGGRIDVEVRVHPSGPGSFELMVRDNGSGMTAETMARIFEPFFTTKAVGKGTGLGLSVVYGIVQQLEGTVDVQSTVGRGSTFVVRLPLSRGAQAPRTEVAAAIAGRGSETVLLVEDDPHLLELGRRVLVHQGYRVLSSSSPRDAIEQATRAGRLDLVVTDMVMPEMNGPALVQELAALGLAPRVLYMSGYTEEEVFADNPTIERTAFLPKPWTPRELARAMRAVLDGSDAPAAA